MTGEQPSDPHAAETDEVTERILRAALRRFAEVGFGSATVDDIAATAGVGVATLYRRWPDKAALANAVMIRHLAAMEELGRAPTSGPPKRRFLDLWRRLWALATDDPDRFVFGEAHAHAGFVSPEVAARKEAMADLAARVLADIGIGASPETAGAILVGTIVSAMQRDDDTGIDPDDLGERLWAALRPGQ